MVRQALSFSTVRNASTCSFILGESWGNAYQCFQCGTSGNPLDLWAAVAETDLHTAAIDLCQKLHLDVPSIRKR